MTIVYHGGNRFNKLHGYKASNKKGRVQFGIGLYTTTAYEWANLYGRKVYAFDIELDKDSASQNVLIPLKHIAEFIRCTCSKQFYKDFVKNVTANEISANRLVNYFTLYHKRPHTIAQELNDFIVAWGAKFTIENGKYDGALIRIHDFSIIKNEIDSTVHNYSTDQLDKNLFAGYH